MATPLPQCPNPATTNVLPEENAGGAQDAVKGGLAGSVHVVEIRFVTASLTAMTGYRRSPAAAMAQSVNTGGGLLGATDDAGSVFGLFTVNTNDEIGSIVKG